jgi:hypothetical protein
MALLSLRGVRANARDVDAEYRPTVHRILGAVLHRTNRVWHRYELRGMDRVPARPVLFVGNHSGVGVADVSCMIGAGYAHFGLRRRFCGMMHGAFVNMPILGFFGAEPSVPR